MEERRACGFTLRLDPSGIAEEPWLREQLLIPERTNIISADSRIWPQPNELDDFYYEALDWHPLGIDTDYEEMLNKLHKLGVHTEGLIPLCITLPVETIVTSKRLCGPWAANYRHEQELLAQGWHFLGFEPVELNGLTSGLKGIGYREPFRSELQARFGAELQARFGAALNEVGLFTDDTISAEFAKIIGAEIPSHAPFDVVAILIHDSLSQ